MGLEDEADGGDIDGLFGRGVEDLLGAGLIHVNYAEVVQFTVVMHQ